MNNFPHDEHPSGECYVLAQDHYFELCEVRDKLLLLAQLAGTASSDDSGAMLFIRRVLLGQLFADLSFKIRDALDGTTHVTVPANPVQTH